MISKNLKNSFFIIISIILLFGCKQKPSDDSSDIFESIDIENYPFTLAPALFDSTLEFDQGNHEKEFLNIDTLVAPKLNFNPQIELKQIDTIKNPSEAYDVTFDISRFYFFKRLKPISYDIEVLLYKTKNNDGNLGFIYLTTYDKQKKAFLDNKVLMVNGYGDDIKTYVSGAHVSSDGQIESIIEYHFFETDIIHRHLIINQDGLIKETNRRYEHKETWEEEYEDNSPNYPSDDHSDLLYELTGEEDNEEDFEE